MELTEKEHHLIIAAYMNGYESGHNDTVESAYTDAYESARDWLMGAIQDGGLKDSLEQVEGLWKEEVKDNIESDYNDPANI